MESDSLQKVIAEWLRGADLPALTPRENPIPALKPPRPILAVVGPRRAGKTYFLYQMIADLLRAEKAGREDILFVDFEDYRLRDFRPDDMDRLLAAHFQLAGRPPRFLFFDEVQRLPSWSRVLRTLHNSSKYTIVATGSSSALLSSEIATELRGRYEDVLILPFSFREYLNHRNIAWNSALLASPESGLILRAFDEYLRFGGFPEAAGVTDESAKRRILQAYFDTTFYKDVLERHRIRARNLLDLLMRNLLEGYAASFSISAFEKQLKAHKLAGSKRSIANYLRHLEEAFFLAACEKFDYSPRKRTMNPKKIYLMDTGFSLLGGAFTENRGRLLENAVAVEFFRRRLKPLYFKNKSECDFIIQTGARPDEAWQVCWELNYSNEKRELKGLADARRDLKISKGGILTYNQVGTRTANRDTIRLIPVWSWLLTSGGEGERS